jgi:hypothetical protein
MNGLLCPVQNIFFLTEHYFNSCVPIALQTGQAAVLGRCVSGAYTTTLYVMVLDGLFYHEGMRVRKWSLPLCVNSVVGIIPLLSKFRLLASCV